MADYFPSFKEPEPAEDTESDAGFKIDDATLDAS